MPLTAEQYGQLTQFLTTPRAAQAPGRELPDRRESPRAPARGPAELRLPTVGGTRTVTVYVQDVSLGGLGVLSGTAVRPYSTVELLLSNGYDDVTLRCSVRHCTRVAVGLYAVGVDALAFEAQQGRPECPAAQADAAWAGFFAIKASACRT